MNDVYIIYSKCSRETCSLPDVSVYRERMRLRRTLLSRSALRKIGFPFPQHIILLFPVQTWAEGKGLFLKSSTYGVDAGK